MKRHILAALLSFYLFGCASAPNVPVCTELSMTRGWCTNTISDEEFYIDDEHPHSFTGDPKDAKTWWELRPYMVLLPTPSWVEVKSYIIKRCKQDGNCQDGVGNWERKINQMDEKLRHE